MLFSRSKGALGLLLQGSTHSPTKVNLGLFFAAKPTMVLLNSLLTTAAVLKTGMASSLRPAICACQAQTSYVVLASTSIRK